MLVNKFKDATTPAQFLGVFVKQYEDKKDIEFFKNELFSIAISILNVHHIKEHDGECLPTELPQLLSEKNDKFVAASIYYKPQGYLLGREEAIEKLLRTNILHSEKKRIST